MRAAPNLIRLAWAVLFALLLTVRSLAPAGFMPAFDRGVVTIFACPDGDGGSAPMRMDGKHDHQSLHQPCPYAATASLGALAADGIPLLALLVFAVPLLLGRTTLLAQRKTSRERPPVRGPPLPA